MNTRAIHVRLIAWYSGLVILVSLGFGAYTYQGVQARLYAEIEQTLNRRAIQISDNILNRIPQESEQAIGAQIHSVYSPEDNNRFIRIMREDHSVLYVSGPPKDGSFNIRSLPIPDNNKHVYFALLSNGAKLLLINVPVQVSGKNYIIQMGMPNDGVETALHGLVITLLFGLPIVVIIASSGGYILVRRSLTPVENIRATAEKITFGNLSNRLPVSTTGDALEHLSVTLNQMLDRLEDAYEQASRFSADASHELRTPLTIMRGELEAMARDNDVGMALRERIGSVLEETERLSRITENLFTISRLDAGESRMEYQLCDLATLARNTAEQMSLLADEKSLALDIDTPNPVSVSGDPGRLKQIVVNLLDNAIKYTPSKGRVALRVNAVSGKAVLEVSDNGIGIPTSALPHVFERFYRADKARSREHGGAGLGLSIVRSIVQAHGGNVEISSNGKGTLCRVELALAG